MLLGNHTYSQPQSCYVVTQTKHLTTPWAKQIDTAFVQEWSTNSQEKNKKLNLGSKAQHKYINIYVDILKTLNYHAI